MHHRHQTRTTTTMVIVASLFNHPTDRPMNRARGDGKGKKQMPATTQHYITFMHTSTFSTSRVVSKHDEKERKAKGQRSIGCAHLLCKNTNLTMAHLSGGGGAYQQTQTERERERKKERHTHTHLSSAAIAMQRPLPLPLRRAAAVDHRARTGPERSPHRHAKQSHAMQCNAMQCNATQRNATALSAAGGVRGPFAERGIRNHPDQTKAKHQQDRQERNKARTEERKNERRRRRRRKKSAIQWDATCKMRCDAM